MTREEAIEILSRPKSMRGVPAEILTAHTMAIKSLDAWDDVQKEIQREKDNISFDINEEKAKWVNSGIHDGLSLAQEIISRYNEVSE